MRSTGTHSKSAVTSPGDAQVATTHERVADLQLGRRLDGAGRRTRRGCPPRRAYTPSTCLPSAHTAAIANGVIGPTPKIATSCASAGSSRASRSRRCAVSSSPGAAEVRGDQRRHDRASPPPSDDHAASTVAS